MSIEYPCVYWSDGMCQKFSDNKSTSWCVEGPCGDQIPSNADKIRTMSDEELAWELMVWRCETVAKHHGISSEYPDTQQTILDWLHQPSEADHEQE